MALIEVRHLDNTSYQYTKILAPTIFDLENFVDYPNNISYFGTPCRILVRTNEVQKGCTTIVLGAVRSYNI